MSTFVTRYKIEDLQCRVWDGNDFTTDEDMGLEYRDEIEAYDDADVIAADPRFGGVAEVVTYRRWSRYGDPVGMTFLHLSTSTQAAE